MADVTDLNTYPIPSSDLNVLERNAQDFDKALNAGNTTFQNRAGVNLPTFERAIQLYGTFNNTGLWVTATPYSVNDLWQSNIDGTWYVVLEGYTSGASEAADIASGNVQVFQTDSADSINASSGLTVQGEIDRRGVDYDTLSDALADTTAVLGDYFTVADYAAGNKSGVLFFKWVAAATGTPDGGSYIDHDTLSLQAQQNFPSTITSKMFGAAGDGVTDDTSAISSALTYVSNNGRELMIGEGVFLISSTIAIPAQSMAIYGSNSVIRQTGTTPRTKTTLAWTGGASPMFTQAVTQVSYRNFAVENRGAATDWLELNSGSINNTYEDLYFIKTSTHTQFSRSVIRSNGNRIGYSQFKRAYCTSPAPVFLDVDGQGTPNGVTPIHFDDRCLFNALTGFPMTVVKIVDETIEMVSFRNCTFTQDADELTIVDSSAATFTSMFNFIFEDNEIDVVGGAAGDLLFKLKKVLNFSFNNNTIAGGGVRNYIGDLVESNLVSCYGNNVTSIVNAVFSLDSLSKANVGLNPTASRPIITDYDGAFTQLTYGVSISIDGRALDPAKHNILIIEITDSAGHTVSIDTSFPQYTPAGTVFTIVTKNVSGGAAAITSFNGAMFNTSGSAVAPANGFNRSYTFYWDGVNAIEISRGAGDVAN